MLNRLFSILKIPFNGWEDDSKIEFAYMTKEKKSRKLKEIFSNPPRFETKRLLLRRIETGDCEDMFEYSADFDVTKYLTWKPHESSAETKNYIKDVQKKYENGKFFDWGLVYRPNGKFIGTCGFTSVNLIKNSCEVGYVLSKNYWGMGLISEALECVMDYAFGYFGFYKVEARFIDGNENSKKVMLKAGMTFEKTERDLLHVRGEYKTVHTYSISKDSYKTHKNILT